MVKQLEIECSHSSAFSAEVKNTRNVTPAPPYTITTQILG
jgi:hypothetical protein